MIGIGGCSVHVQRDVSTSATKNVLIMTFIMKCLQQIFANYFAISKCTVNSEYAGRRFKIIFNFAIATASLSALFCVFELKD